MGLAHHGLVSQTAMGDEAYEEWRVFADDADPQEDVLIEETTVIA